MSKIPVHKRITAELSGLLNSHGLLDQAESVLKYSLLDAPRVCAIIRACERVAGLEGDSAEVGCASGGTSRLIKLMAPERHHWACDTFQGLMDADGGDGGLKNGDFANHESQLEAIRERNADLTALTLVRGYFPECAPPLMESARFSLVHLDTDTYQSMRAGYTFFAPRMVKGGVMILDDVIGKGTKGGKRFWCEVTQSLEARSFRLLEKNDPHVVIQFI